MTVTASTPPVVAPWDLPGQVAQAINAWLLSVAQSIFAFALHAIADLLTVTPHFERAPEVARLWNLTRGIATGFLVVIALIGGVLLMTSGVAGTRYTVKLIISRLLLAALLANVSLSVFSTAVDLNNALNAALLGGTPLPQNVLGSLQSGMSALNGAEGPVAVLMALVAGVLMLALVVVYVARSALLVITLVAAPLALICYALPQSERVTWAWWRVTAATFLLQPVNALLLGIAGRVFFSSQIGWGLNPVSLLIGPLMAIVLLYLLIRTPWWIYQQMIAPETHHRVGQGRSVVPSSLRAELIVELQIQDSIVAGRTPLELSYLLAAGTAGWALLQLPYPLVVQVGLAALFAVAGAALAFVRVAGQDLTSWCAALLRHALASRLAVYGPSHPR